MIRLALILVNCIALVASAQLEVQTDAGTVRGAAVSGGRVFAGVPFGKVAAAQLRFEDCEALLSDDAGWTL